MRSFRYTVADPVGLHARPAGNFVKAVKDLDCAVTIRANGRTADAKKLMAVMTLGVRQGQEIEVSFEGPGEEEACAAIERYVKENL